jgi:hypothetical protein
LLNFYWFVSLHSLLDVSIRCLFLNWLKKFAPMCLMHHLLQTSRHLGGSPVSTHPSCKSSIALSMPAWWSWIRQTSSLSRMTANLTRSRNRY